MPPASTILTPPPRVGHIDGIISRRLVNTETKNPGNCLGFYVPLYYETLLRKLGNQRFLDYRPIRASDPLGHHIAICVEKEEMRLVNISKLLLKR